MELRVKAMNVRTFHVYFVDERPVGYEITDKPYPASLRGFDVSHEFFGARANLVVVSNDRDVDRPVSLRFASAIAFGTYKTVSVDLKKVGIK
jgi:hypothetical protein